MESLGQGAYREILEALPAGVYLVDRDRRILLWSSGAEEITGYPRQQVMGRCCGDDLLMHCDENHSLLCGAACPLQLTMHDGHPRTAEVFLLHKNGQRIPVTVRAVPFRNENGAIIGAIECFGDRVALPDVNPQLCVGGHSSTVDLHTGLPDRTAVLAGLHIYLGEFGNSKIPFGVLSIELEDTDRLRRTAGQKAVDALRRVTSNTLAASLGPNDFIGCWSEKRFLTVVMPSAPSTLSRVAARLKEVVRMERVPWWGEWIPAAVSVGGAIVRAGDTVEELIRRAEDSLEESRQQHGLNDLSGRVSSEGLHQDNLCSRLSESS